MSLSREGAGGAAGPALVSHVTASHGPGLEAAVERLVAPFGGWPAIVAPGERIAVKVNLLRAAEPARAVTTHPETLRCVLRGLKAAGAVPFVADSPGGPNPPMKVARTWRLGGLDEVCREEGVELRDVEDEAVPMPAPNGRLFRSFPVARSFLDADGIVQVGPLKTHQLMRLTGGVKLTFGCIPGMAKPALHARLPERARFADMLLDLHLAVAPRFTIIDAIIAMQGQGPGGGDPVELDSLFAARDAVALDAALAVRTGHRFDSVHTLAAAARRGLVDPRRPYEPVGDPIAVAESFVPARADLQDRLPRSVYRLGRRAFTARPRLVIPDACINCKECQRICATAACRVDKLPDFSDEACVRCYACTEVCPTGAIDAVNPPLVRIADRLRPRRRRSSRSH